MSRHEVRSGGRNTHEGFPGPGQAPVRHTRSRLAFMLAAGVAAGLPTAVYARPDYAPAVGWAAASLTYLIWVWAVIGRLDGAATAAHARSEDPGRKAADILVLTATVASFGGVALILLDAAGAQGPAKAMVLTMALASVALSWFLVHTLFTLRYAMLYYRDRSAEGRRIHGLAGDADVRPDWAPVADRIRSEATDDWDDTVAVDRFTGKGGRFVRGRGRITGPRTVSAAGREFTARRAIVVNTGTEPMIPPIPGLADVPYWTNREAIAATVLPESLIVVGGGAIGAELAQAFARFGTRVTVLEAAPGLLPPEEPEAGKLLEGVLRGEGIDVHVGARIESIRHSSGTFTVDLGGSTLRGGRLLVAAGRTTNLEPLGVAALGLDPAARFLDPDGHMRIADGVYAIGDITGKGAFTHVSMYQASIAAAHILGQDPARAEYHAVPRVTFTDPEIGSVGITEAQARGKGLNVRVGLTDLATSARGWLHKSGNQGFIKLVEDADHGVLVGATSAGPAGGEVLSALTLAVHARIPVCTLRRMIYAYPTFHRAIEDALDRLE